MNNTDFKVEFGALFGLCVVYSGANCVFLMAQFCFLQQLYQTLSDFDIRFYMYEILKVRKIFFYISNFLGSVLIQ